MVAILSAVLGDGLDAVEAASQEAFDQNVCSSAVIINILAPNVTRRRRSPPSHPTRFACAMSRRPTAPVTTASEGKLMERTEVLDLMGTLKLYGMRSANDEVMATGIKRRHEPPRIVGGLLLVEIAEKQARSIKYQLTVAKLPLAKDIEEFDFDGTPVNEALIRELANGALVADQP